MADVTALKRCPHKDHQGPNPLPVTEFGKSRNSADGLACWCKACRKAIHAAAPEKARERAARWYQENPDKAKARVRRIANRLRNQVLDHYGRACACCGATENLDIDHMNGDGRAHRIELFGSANPGSTVFYRWLVKQGFPVGYQVLCHPCNASKQTGETCQLLHRAA